MAAQAADLRNDRVVVLFSKAEKALLAARARAKGMTVSDFVRAAAERYELDQEDLPADFEAEVLWQMEQIKARMQATFSDLDAYLADRQEPDREAIRAETMREMEALHIDWDEVRSRLGLEQ
jgi:hypothetical protein